MSAKRALTRAALLCKEPRFRAWIAHSEHGGRITLHGTRYLRIMTEEGAAAYLRRALGVTSRAEIAENDNVRKTFEAIELEYRMATPGLIAERRG
jgi:hypothetical protein